MRAVALNGVEVRRRQEEIDHFDARAQVGGDLYHIGSSDVSSATSNTGHATKKSARQGRLPAASNKRKEPSGSAKCAAAAALGVWKNAAYQSSPATGTNPRPENRLQAP